MSKTLQFVVEIAVRETKRRTSLLWADRLADRIADASPLPFDRSDLSERLTIEAVRQGIPVVIASERAIEAEGPKAAS
jgi:hypothetical protein